MEPTAVFLLLGGLVLVVLVWGVAVYNRFVRLRQHLQESWAGIDVELKRRYELIPNLVRTVRGYAEHERETLEQVVRLRDRAMANRGTAASQGVDETALLLGMKRLFAVVEGYPGLRADEGFLALQKELRLTEDRIAAARRFFNANTREMNQLCRSFPTNLVARAFRFEPGTFFELDREAERVVPEVDLTAPGRGS